MKVREPFLSFNNPTAHMQAEAKTNKTRKFSTNDMALFDRSQ